MREDILGGLKLALSRGDSLQNAMQSFYNSGYSKEEIEEAARALHKQIVQQPPQISYPPQQQRPAIQPKSQVNLQPYVSPQVRSPLPIQPIQTIQTPKPETRRTSALERPLFSYQNPEENVIPEDEKELIVNRFKQLRTTPDADKQERVSNYGSEYKRPGLDAVTVILIIILLALLGVLAAVFFFKDELIEFLNKFLD